MDATAFTGVPLLWISLINSGYLPFARHFVGNLRALALDWRDNSAAAAAERGATPATRARARFPLLVVATDAGAMAGLRELGVAAWRLPDERPHAQGLTAWATPQYKRLVFSKLDAVRFALEAARAAGIPLVGFIDFDLALLRDPTPSVLAAVRAPPRHTAVFMQCDEDHATRCSAPRACPYPNSGFMVLRTYDAYAPTLRRCLAYTEADIAGHCSDQTLFRELLDRHGVPRATLDPAAYLNGARAGVAGPPHPLPRAATLVHYNYLVGADKMRRMQAWGHWHW